MTILSASEQILGDTHPQQIERYLSIYEPQIAMRCQTAGAYDHSTQTILYGSVTTGSYTNIGDYMFQVALIGTTEGADDKGRTWVRSANGSTLRFVESDHINWQVGDYITVLKYTEIIPVFPRIIQDPGDQENVIFYKIWDVAYTNQNSILGTFINMGCNTAGFLDGGTFDVYYSASGTSNLLGDSLTYSWIFEGATVTGSSANTPGLVSYNTPGFYRTILNVTSSSGRTDTSIRYVSVYDRPGQGNNVPILKFSLNALSGSRDGGGYSCNIKLLEAVDRNKIKDGALVILFSDDWYGDTKQSFGGNSYRRSNIKFVGYINDETIQYDYDTGYAEFEVISPTKLMEITECFSVSVQSMTSPTTWYELLNMTTSKALYHYYAWHSTVLMCCDFTFNSDDEKIQYFDSDRESLYSAGNTLMNGAMQGKLISDRQGNIYAERNPEVRDQLASALSTALDMDRHDWIETPTINKKTYREVSFIEMGGIQFEYAGASGTSTALLADAPGTSPAYHGKVERTQGLALTGQTELNTMVGNLFAAKNAVYSGDYRLRSAWWNLDIVPMEKVLVTAPLNESPLGVAWNQKPFTIDNITWTFNEKSKVAFPQLALKEITQGFPGTTVIIPDVPPVEGEEGGTHGVPPYVPPTPTPTPSGSGSSTTQGEYCYLYAGIIGPTSNDAHLDGGYINWGDGEYTAGAYPIYKRTSDDAVWYPAKDYKIYFPAAGSYYVQVQVYADLGNNIDNWADWFVIELHDPEDNKLDTSEVGALSTLNATSGAYFITGAIMTAQKIFTVTEEGTSVQVYTALINYGDYQYLSANISIFKVG